MKAVLHENPLERYETVYEGRKKMEISGETVVPDKMPDIGLLGDASAHVLLRSKRAENGRGIVEGDLSVSIFYVPDGGIGFHVLRMQLPWAAEFDSEEISVNSNVLCDVHVMHLETRMLNPRKILLKAELEGHINAFEQRKDMICDAIAENDIIQIQRNSMAVSVVSAVCEKTFVATDEYPLPPDINGGEVIAKSVQFRVDDVKTLANKLIVKGSVLSDVVVASDDGATERLSFTSGFSFIAETDCDQVSDNVSMCIIPTALYYEPVSNGRVLSVEVHCVCQMTVYENSTVAYIADAYSNFYVCSCEWDNLTVYQTAKRMLHRENVTEVAVCRSQIDCVRFLTASYTVIDNGENSQITVLAGAYVQYENGGVDWVKKQVTVPIGIKYEEQLTNVRLSDLRGRSNGSEIEFYVTIEWETMDLESVSVSHIAELIWDEEQCLEQRKESMTVVREGGRLWDLARKYRSTIKLTQTYNQLDEDDEHVSGLLLIPTQRK